MMPIGFSDGFTLTVVPLLILVLFLFIVFKGIKQWNYNNSQPVLSVWAKVVSRRTNVSYSASYDLNNISYYDSLTTYFATFEVESGNRMEFQVRGREYGMLTEGDIGKLTFQGTGYLGFNRESS
jgi:hypothetical protein